MMKIKLKIIKGIFGIYGTIYKIQKISEISDKDKIEIKTDCIIGDRKYNIGQEIKEEYLHRLKIPGVQLIYETGLNSLHGSLPELL